ncbi:MAG: ABC transporter substrate-binding protein [Clostridia bacterium]|nr:ABC transporter substrate-binding protein [Clostridia bacterium]
MKKLLSVLLVLALSVALFAGCGSENTSSTNQTANDTAESEELTPAQVRLAGLKGPTTMGLAKLLDDSNNKKTKNTYTFEMATSGDQITPKIMKGEIDIAAIPVNLGSVLYNKTNGKVKMIAVNTLGVLYILEKGGNTVKSVADLKGKTIYATGKGTTPEYALTHILEKNGLTADDVTFEWKSEPTEVVSTISTKDNAVAMIPQPFATVAMSQVEGLSVALDLTEEWDKVDKDSKLITSGIFVNAQFAEKNPDAVKLFLKDYEESAKYVNEKPAEAAKIIEELDIVKAAIAQKAIPKCNIVNIVGKDMIKYAKGYIETLVKANAASVGGKAPGDDFYLIYE